MYARIEIHLVHTEDDLFHAGAFCEDEEAAHNEWMWIRRCRRDGDNDLRKVRHAWSLQEIRARFDAVDHALSLRYPFDGYDVTGDRRQVAAPLLHPAAQLAEDHMILCRDVEYIVIDL